MTIDSDLALVNLIKYSIRIDWGRPVLTPSFAPHEFTSICQDFLIAR
jgi:hypothetical protein